MKYVLLCHIAINIVCLLTLLAVLVMDCLTCPLTSDYLRIYSRKLLLFSKASASITGHCDGFSKLAFTLEGNVYSHF